MGQVILAGIARTTSLVSCLLSYVIATHLKVLNRFHLKVPNLQMSCKDLIARQATKTQMVRFMGPTWGPPGSCRPQMGPILASWTLLSGDGSPSNSWDDMPHSDENANHVMGCQPDKLPASLVSPNKTHWSFAFVIGDFILYWIIYICNYICLDTSDRFSVLPS